MKTHLRLCPALRLAWLVLSLMAWLQTANAAGLAKPTIYAFNVAAETTINRGQTATLNWSVSSGATVTLSPGFGAVAGTQADVTPQETTTYTLTATNAAGSVTKSKKITVIVPPAFQSLTATPDTVAAGGSASLAWAAPGASYFAVRSDIDGDLGNVFGNKLTVRPRQTTQYTITAVNTAGNDVRSIVVPVTAAGGKPSIGAFSASPATVTAGAPVTLSWSASGATSLSISPGIGAVTGTTKTVNPLATTTYTLTATNARGSVTKSVTVAVQTAAPTIGAFTATPANITAGDSATLNWTVSGATALAIAADVGVSPGPVTGNSVDVKPTATTTYTLTASNAGGSTTATVAVTVKDTAPAIHSFASIPNSIQAGESVKIIWDVSGAATLTIAADVGPSPGVVTGATGAITVSPAATTLYTMTATSAGGTVTTSVTQVLVAGGSAQGPQIASFSASPANISRGDSTSLSWSVSGADSVSISPDPGVVTGTTATVSPMQTTTYTLTATNSYGAVTQTLTVTVTGPPLPLISSFSASPAFITAGQSSNLSWAVSGADSVQIAPDIGAVTGSSYTVTPAATTTYTLTATNGNGSSTATAVVTLYTAGNGQVTHPRIWVTPASLNGLTAKAAGNDAAWVRLRAECDYYATLPVAYPDQSLSGDSINGGYQYNDYLQPAAELGLGYLVAKTVDPVRAAKYAAKEKQLLLALSDPVRHGRPSTDSGYGIRGYVPSLALGYDWIFETLSDSERAQIFTEINRWIEYYDASGFGRNFPQGNYFAGYYTAKALGALATEGENPNAAAMWNDWLNRIHYGMVQPYHAQWLSGGGAPDGWNYGQLETINMLRPIAAAFTAKGLDLIHDAAKPFAYPDGHAKWITQFTWPDMKSVSDRGFVYDNDNPTWTDAGWATHYAGLLRLANGDNAALMQTYAVDLRNQQGLAKTEPWIDFLYFDAGAAKASYRTDLSYRTNGDGQVAMRSSWASDAVWGAFQAGPYTGFPDSSEEFFDEGSLAIQRGGVQFLVNGWGALMRNTPGTADSGGTLFTSVYNELFDTQSDGVYHGRRLFNTYYAVRSGGYWGQVGAGPGETATRLTHFEDAGAYVLMRGESLEGMYLAPHPISGWTRTVAYLRPNLFVVYDRTSVTSASADNWMAWHVAAAPAEITPAAAGMHAYDVADTRPALGGNLYRGRVSTVLPYGNQVTAIDTFGKGKVYRLEVRAGAAVAANTWLAVFDAASSASAAGTATPLAVAAGTLTDATVEGTLIAVPNGAAYAVLFSRSGATVGGSLALSLPASPVTGLIADLTPNTGYTVGVTRNGTKFDLSIAPGGPIKTSANGTLYFVVKSDGTVAAN